jgi:hypothetical protein
MPAKKLMVGLAGGEMKQISPQHVAQAIEF